MDRKDYMEMGAPTFNGTPPVTGAMSGLTGSVGFLKDSWPKIRFQKLHKDTQLPVRATPQSAGYDLFAYLDDRTHNGRLTIEPGHRVLVSVGFKMAIAPGYEVQIRPRSGLSLKTGLLVPNSPGTIDSDYRGDVMVILANVGDKAEIVKHGDRIAQMVIAPVCTLPFEEVDSLEETERVGGFGSTGQ